MPLAGIGGNLGLAGVKAAIEARRSALAAGTGGASGDRRPIRRRHGIARLSGVRGRIPVRNACGSELKFGL